MTEIPTTVKNKDLVERRRNQIVLAAIKLFARNGFHKTTLKELAEEAGLSYGNIYDYVGNKEDIFFLIHDFLAGSAMEILNRSIEKIQDPIEKLRRMVRGEFNLMDQWADALLLIYQETHILKGPFLRKLLEKERAHLEKFESVFAEAVDQERLRACNVRLVSNLVKSMIDSWTIKRWDLRGHAGQMEAEHAILDILFNGLLLNGGPRDPETKPGENPLRGKNVLVVHTGTRIGRGIGQAFEKRGAKVVYVGPGDNTDEIKATGVRTDFEALEDEHGAIDIYVHDIGVGIESIPTGETQTRMVVDRLRRNLEEAQTLSNFFSRRMKARRNGRIVYVSPWMWDRHADPLVFESVKAGTAALCRTMASEMAAFAVNVNGVSPGYIRTARPTDIEKTLKEAVVSGIPAGRLGEIDDVTEAVLFLIADTSKYLTGQMLHLTGGGE